MKCNITLFYLFLFLVQPLFCQNTSILAEEDIITLKYYRKGVSTQGQNGMVYKFDQSGKMLSIKSSFLNPVMSAPKDATYTAFYNYDEQGNLLEENVFEIIETESTLFRITKYSYSAGCTKAMVYDGKNKEHLGEIVDCQGDDWRRQSFAKDIVLLGKPLFFHENIVDWKLNANNSIQSLVISGATEKVDSLSINCQFQHKPRHKSISTTWPTPDTLSTFYLHRFYDSRNRLVKMSTSPKKSKWFTRLSYGQLGFIEKVTKRGRMNKTNEKVTQYFIVEINLSNRSYHKLKKDKTVIRKINQEFLKLHYPLTGWHLDYIDSRRFFQ